MSADLTLVNLNMLFMRYGEQVERERHVPLGCLYLTAALERAGFTVDFRDYQLSDSDDPFDVEAFLSFVADPAPVIGLSCMANLLPFTLLAARALKDRYPDRKIVLGGVGTKAIPALAHPLQGWTDCTGCHAPDKLVQTAPGHTGIHKAQCTVCHTKFSAPAPDRPHNSPY